jgi:mannitol 2-dehydrogenase
MSLEFFDVNYDRKQIKPGILHFGVGNFHRAHQEYYTNLLLEHPDQAGWGICGAMILDRDEKIFKGLIDQNCEYGLTVFGRTGRDEYRRIGSIVELLWGAENPAAIIDKIAEPDIKIITLTITEGGYNLAKETRAFDFANLDIIHDLNKPVRPKTVFGYIAAGLRKRIENNAGPITILTCDNLPHNGRVCHDSFMAFFEKADETVYHWARANVTFPSTMVDRITPATTEEDITKLEKYTGKSDRVPVFCEDFVQWVIEDNFAAGRPAWERVGVEFTGDVAQYENMKLGYVNSTHLMLSFPGFLAGYRKVNEAVEDKRIEEYLRQYMDLDVTPYMAAPPNTDLKEYRQIFMERLLNKSVSDQLARLCFDVANKFPVYSKHPIQAMINAGAEMKRVAYFIASYRLYLRRGVDDLGVPYQVVDPGLIDADQPLIKSHDPLEFLKLSCMADVDYKKSQNFIDHYLEYCAAFDKQGVLTTLESVIE